jgi:pimeloyl-ACP methyl ester carboxylesterase
MIKAHAFGISLAAVLLTTCPALEARSAGIDTVKNIVLVHGAGNDGSAWRGVYDILRKDGYHVSVVQEPLTGLSMMSRPRSGSLTNKTGR